MNEPTLWRSARNFAQALLRHWGDGCRDVEVECYRERLEACGACPLQRETRCLVCGCRVEIKARWRSETCPAGRWPD
ncbi:MAG: DUF6171 family protein [Planctomycetales bacterium]